MCIIVTCEDDHTDIPCKFTVSCCIRSVAKKDLGSLNIIFQSLQMVFAFVVLRQITKHIISDAEKSL